MLRIILNGELIYQIFSKILAPPPQTRALKISTGVDGGQSGGSSADLGARTPIDAIGNFTRSIYYDVTDKCVVLDGLVQC